MSEKNTKQKVGELIVVVSNWIAYGGLAEIAVDAYVTGTAGEPAPKSILIGGLGGKLGAKKEGAYLLTIATGLQLLGQGLQL
jgi:hypothetical protein